MIVTLDQLKTYIEKCKELRKKCDNYLHVPDYCIEEHRNIFEQYEKAFKYAWSMYEVYKLN